MVMRRVELLINDIKFNTNNQDDNRYPDIRLLKFFNDAQDTIQAIIHTSNTNGKFFNREAFLDVVFGQETYDLPTDCYTHNAINSIGRRVSGDASSDYYTPLRQLTEKERRKEFGYALLGRQVLISPIPRDGVGANAIRVNYTYKLPRLSIRVGQIKSLISGTQILLKNGTFDQGAENSMDKFADFVCIVGKDGKLKDSELNLNAWNPANGKITTDSVITNGAVDDYVVLGSVASSHSDLPEEVEHLLTIFVERKIQAVDSSADVSNADLLTESEQAIVTKLFADNEHDTKYPPITDDTYLNY